MADPEISRFPYKELPCMPGSTTTPGWTGARVCARAHVAFRSLDSVGARDNTVSRLNGWPACSPTDASPTPSRRPAHGSGPMWFATPSSQWTFTIYSLPVSRRTQSSARGIIPRRWIDAVEPSTLRLKCRRVASDGEAARWTKPTSSRRNPSKRQACISARKTSRRMTAKRKPWPKQATYWESKNTRSNEAHPHFLVHEKRSHSNILVGFSSMRLGSCRIPFSDNQTTSCDAIDHPMLKGDLNLPKITPMTFIFGRFIKGPIFSSPFS